MDRYGAFLDANHATAVLLDDMSRTLHLTITSLAPQLGNQLKQLADAGGANRVSPVCIQPSMMANGMPPLDFLISR